MKASFLNAASPFVTEMVQEKTIERTQMKIRNAIACGATAVGVQLSALEKRDRTKENLSAVFASAEGKPVYVTNYRNGTNAGVPDEALMDELSFSLDCGATLVDMMGDTFDPSPEELTTNEAAIKRQMEWIDGIHRKGGEVLMSSHIREFRSPERVLEVALEQQRRGADMAKIVTGAETEDEELVNLQICHLLKKELKIPFLFLSGGKCCGLHRTIGPALGVSMWLCFREYDESTYVGPPLLENVLKIKQGLKI